MKQNLLSEFGDMRFNMLHPIQNLTHRKLDINISAEQFLLPVSYVTRYCEENFHYDGNKKEIQNEKKKMHEWQFE